MNQRSSKSAERLYQQALNIQYGKERGLWLPKMTALALRGHSDAMVDLADWLAGDDSELGSAAASLSAASLYNRAYRKGNARAAHNLAMTLFNRNDLFGYRKWMRKAARAGDDAARLQVARFEIRLPHAAARKIGRKRPEHERDEFA
jgi:hypothetical protein